MFSQHVTNNISAYCHGELSTDEAREFSEHILACAKCRAEFEEIKLGIRFAEQITLVPAPEGLWAGIDQKLAGVLTERPAKPRFAIWNFQYVAIASAILLVVLAGLWWLSRDDTSTHSTVGWNVQRLNGTIKIGSTGVRDKGKLGVGEWLETGGNSKAEIAVGSIGSVELDSDTRVRLLQTQPTEHRLELARGKMSAHIWAPPRLFFVDTPSAVAADLGCAYTLEVDDAGASLLRVTSGWVALELKERESIVPAGAACETRPGVGPGTPYFEDALPEFRQALTKVDFESDSTVRSSALDLMLARSRSQDTLTLWHLLARVNERDRGKIYDKIVSFVVPPKEVTREGIMRLDSTMLQVLKNQLEPSWYNPVFGKKVADAYWRLKNGLNRRADNLERKLKP